MKEKLTKIVNSYTLILLGVFPLLIVHSYYDIQDVKMYLYLYATICAFLLVFGVRIRYALSGRDKRERGASEGKGGAFKRILGSLYPADFFAAVFFLVTALSTACSEWVYEAFWGNTARFQGGFLWMWYIVTYFLISRHYVPKRFHMDIFLGAGVIVCAWGVLDYFSLSPIGVGYERLFSSTFGNINVLTAVEAMYLAAASVMFLGTPAGDRKGCIRSLLYFLAAGICFMGLVCGRTANAVLSFGFLLCFLPFYAFRSRRGIVRYAGLVSCFLAVLLLVSVLTRAFPEYACTPDYQGELAGLAVRHGRELAVLLAAAAVLTALLFAVIRRGAGKDADASLQAEFPGEKDRRIAKRLRILWAVLGLAAFCVLAFVFYDANLGGNAEKYAALSNYLVFDERWGTWRGYVWRLAMKYYREFSPLKKLIGSGPETFSVYVLIHDLNATLRRFDLNYDSMHNEWLQHLFETGIIGFLSYYGMNAACLAEAFTTPRRRPGDSTAALLAAAFGYALLVYLVQSFVNISVPLILPLAMVCMSAAAAAGRNR